MAKRKMKAADPATIDQIQALRQQLVWLLEGGNAHVKFQRAVENLPPRLRGARATGFAHTSWQLLEHMRLAQLDILEFSLSAEHKSPPWPEGYWPAEEAPASAAHWTRAIATFLSDLDKMKKLVMGADLFAPIPWGTGQTILREALLLPDHNAYHLGQLVAVRRALGAWKE